MFCSNDLYTRSETSKVCVFRERWLELRRRHCSAGAQPLGDTSNGTSSIVTIPCFRELVYIYRKRECVLVGTREMSQKAVGQYSLNSKKRAPGILNKHTKHDTKPRKIDHRCHKFVCWRIFVFMSLHPTSALMVPAGREFRGVLVLQRKFLHDCELNHRS